jgi:tetratricopeptide (TPR) repeat protein
MDKGAQTQSALSTYEEAQAWAYANNALAEVSDIIGAMLDLLNERDTPEQVASLLVEQQDVLYQINPDDSRCKVLLERAYELWMGLGETSEAAAALMRMAMHHTGTSQEDAYYRDAQGLLEREDPKHAMLPSIYLRRALYAANQGPPGQGQNQNCDELFERARSLALQLHDVETLARIHFEMGLYLRNNHQLTEALSAFQQALSYFSQFEDVSPDERILTCNYLADLYYHLGQPADGEYFAVEAVNDAPRGSDLVQVLPSITLSECYAAQARWQEAIQTLKDAPANLAPPELPPRFWLGRWQFESGDTLGGLETMRESMPGQNLECMLVFVDYLLEASMAEEASIRLHQMVKQGRFSDPNTTIPAQAFYDRLRGRLATASKDYNRAVALLDRAMRQFDRESFVLLAISTRRAYATALIGRCGLGDEQAARDLMDESIALCKNLTIHAESRRLQETLRAHWPDHSRR